MIEIRYVKLEDKEFWYSLDKHLSEQEFIDNNYNPIGKVEEYTIYKFNQYVPE